MNSVLRAKMQVDSVTRDLNEAGEVTSEQVKLSAVYGPEGSGNADWAQWTPYAALEMNITNPSAFGKLASGQEFYVDFTPAEKSE